MPFSYHSAAVGRALRGAHGMASPALRWVGKGIKSSRAAAFEHRLGSCAPRQRLSAGPADMDDVEKGLEGAQNTPKRQPRPATARNQGPSSVPSGLFGMLIYK